MQRCTKLTDVQKRELRCIITHKESSPSVMRRAQAILMRDAGTDAVTIQELTGFTREYAFRLRKHYLADGLRTLEDKKKKNPKELLTQAQRGELIRLIQEKTPNEVDSYYNSDYWTTGIVAEHIWRTWGVLYKSKTSVYILFRQAKFSYHKPGRTYERRNEQEVQQWRKEAALRIQRAWEEKETVILVADEMSLSTQTTVQKIWLRQGDYPKIDVARKRESRSIYGFLNIKTGRECAFKTTWQNMYITATILKKIRKRYPAQKLLLVWDQAPSHKGSKAQAVIKKDGNMETIWFPAAAPEQNPQEHVWKKGRSHVTHNAFIQDIDKATNAFVNYLNTTTFPYQFLGFQARPE